ncbi:MAG: chemotaxis protein CheW [Deltaproteobacteria bacterium]|nr:chemotaxis protein CheW [Deltaproteobacteria bacterium]MBW2382660.1 chemotaxis protein CheW [Deltaproteobacteria bacterium]MBW2695185.1 chemotaxis protein CheW [Deltaproteobacteria bacterium]
MEPSASLPARSETPALAASVRVRTDTLDRFLGAVGEVILSSSQLRSAAAHEDQNAEVQGGFDRVERRVAELQRRVMELRTTPLARVTDNLPRTARQIAERLGKRVEVEVLGSELELDRSILDRLGEPLLHIVRNAVDHGLETPHVRQERNKPDVGRLVIEARRQKDSILISVADDGGGIDLERVKCRAVEVGLLHEGLADDLPASEAARLIFQPGLSTATSVSDVSGRGVGMDAVKATIESLGGTVEIQTELGAGTCTTLIVPITAAVQRVLIVGLGDERVAIPITKVERILEVKRDQVEGAGGDSFTLIDDDPILMLDLARRVRVPLASEPSDEVLLVLTELRGERVALRVDRFVGQQEIYVKSIPDLLLGNRLLAGMTVLEDGSPIFLLDMNHIA